ncbi:MAG: hypothetical protein D3918_05560 [Candidatus Electrothrix sp. AX2]|nr:hypothetical protein [Candidatus Electrothrix gigas]
MARISCCIFVLILLSVKVSFAGFFDKPFPVCGQIKSYLAYEIAVAVKGRCDPVGVIMEVKDLHTFFNSALTSKEASPGRCRAACLLLDTTQGLSMEDCVNNHFVRPFVDTMMEEGIYNKERGKWGRIYF